MLLYADPAQTDAAFLARLFLLLPPEKQSAIAHIRHLPSRRESILGWGLLLYAWRLKTGEQTLPPLVFSERGKPFFKDASLAFSISHTDTLVCLALSETGNIGVDAQTLRLPSERLAQKVLTEAERAVLAKAADPARTFTRFWTQKEALVKQTGEGIARGLSTLDFAPWAKEDRFYAFGLQFFSETIGSALVTQCAKQLSSKPSQAVTQRQMEKVLFFEKDG